MVSEGDSSDAPFSYVRREDGTVLISYRGAPLRAVRGHAADRFVARVERADAASAQALMARVASATTRATAPRR